MRWKIRAKMNDKDTQNGEGHAWNKFVSPTLCKVMAICNSSFACGHCTYSYERTSEICR